MERFILVIFSRKTGRISKTLEGYGNALLRMYALRSLTKSQDGIIFERETGKIHYYFEGNGNFPNIVDIDENENIEDYCEGLLSALN